MKNNKIVAISIKTGVGYIVCDKVKGGYYVRTKKSNGGYVVKAANIRFK